jgi:LPPG:FO 2-phospho-L-lactate transferase
MTDDSVATIVDTVEQGELAFQEYCVHQHCEPTVKGFRFAGVESARPAPGVLEALERADAVVFCPSNPWVSIDPILATLTRPSATLSLSGRGTVVAVSPIIGGQTVKGPAAKMFAELGITPSALAVAEHYGSSVSGMVIDSVDAALKDDIEKLGQRVLIINTLMKTQTDRIHLAQAVLNSIERLS